MTKTATNTPPGFDFSALDTSARFDDPFEFPLTNTHTGEEIPGVFVSVVSTEGTQAQAYIRSTGNAARKKAFEAERKGKDQGPTTIEEDEDSMILFAAECMAGWRTVINGTFEPVILDGGEKLEFSKGAALAWLRKYKAFRFHVQVLASAGEVANFIAG